ncbi:MAG: hypothetical protein AAB847_02115 [Patescibacteria group bacterium]
MRRFLKQVIYGVLFLLILALVGGAIFYFFWPKASCTDNKLNQNEEGVDCGGQCIPCALKNPEPLTISSVEIFDNGNNTVTVLGEIHNPNQLLGSENFTYTINLFDKNGKNIFSEDRETFIYPGKNRTIVEAAIDIPSSGVDRAEMMIDDIGNWQEEEKFNGIPEKNIAVDKVSAQGFGGSFVLKGKLINNNSFKVDKIIVKAILYNRNSLRESASLTVLENLDAFKSADWTIQIPMRSEAASRIDPDKTKIIVEIPR